MKSDKYISNFSLKLYILFQKNPFLRKFKIVMFYIDTILLLFIKKPKPIENKKKQILIIYNFAFGDGVIWLCSTKKIREIYPSDSYEITLICQNGLNYLYEKEEIFDRIIPFNLTAATFNLKIRYILYKLLRSRYYDIVLDPIGVAECTTNVFMSHALVAKEKITILDTTLKKKLCPQWLINSIYTKIIEVKKTNLSLIEFYAEFMRGLGLKDFSVSFEKPLSIPTTHDLPKEYFIIFPSASTYLKCWPIDRYADITKKIYQKTGMKLLLCGTEKDKDIIEQYKIILNNEVPYCDIVGKTKLLEFVDIIKKASLVVTNDTSTYHIAAVSEVPVAIIAGGYTYSRYVKYDFEGKKEFKEPCIIVKKMPCFDCDNRCPYINNKSKIWPCLDQVTSNYAWGKIEKLIEDNHIGR